VYGLPTENELETKGKSFECYAVFVLSTGSDWKSAANEAIIHTQGVKLMKPKKCTNEWYNVPQNQATGKVKLRTSSHIGNI
jgi:hypothetical protein